MAQHTPTSADAAAAQALTTAYLACDALWRELRQHQCLAGVADAVGEARATAATKLRQAGGTPEDREALFRGARQLETA